MMTMFHLKYPANQIFFSWDEMGCLCRALGFPAIIIQVQVQTQADEHEIQYNDKGISMKHVHRIIELNLLYKVLHRTFNMHTADWNCCVISKALYLLSHKALSFEELHNVRVAYLTYEHIDMKGMPLVKHTLLRTLKMCGRTIAPMKLMHRLKHMKGQFEEKGRIQLYEFFDLILWCDVYTTYKPEEAETSSGKEDELFKLVDFKHLLSHHDQRMANTLDQVYLKEEWDFGMESLGPKSSFNEPVVNTDARIAQEESESYGFQLNEESNFCQKFLQKNRQETQFHKRNYQGLKHEVVQAQKRVYRAHAGSIRPRPVSAPDVDQYRRTTESSTQGRSTAQEAYETVQKRLHSAPTRSSTSCSFEKPALQEHVRVHTPSVVSCSDMRDVQLKMENLHFDMNTLDVRCQLQVEKEMEFYIPAYSDKLANKKPEVVPVPEPERKKIHWTSKIINNLAYPSSNLKPAHARNCDARFRGWEKINKRQGYHTVLTTNFHENSEKGRMFAKMEQTAMEPVQYLHPEHVLRYTPKDMALQGRLYQKTKKLKSNGDLKSILSHRTDEKRDARSNLDGKIEENQQPKLDIDFLHAKYIKDEKDMSKDARNVAEINVKIVSEDDTQWSYPRGLSDREEVKAVTIPPKDINSTIVRSVPETRTEVEMPENMPIPHMEHSKAKIVGVGQIGTISLLESIQESRDLEEKFDEETSPSEKPFYTIDLPSDELDSTEPENVPEDDDVEDAEKLNEMLQLEMRSQKSIKSRKSRSAPTLREKRFSPRKVSPRKGQRVGHFEKRSSSAGDPKKSVRGGDRKTNAFIKEGQSRVTSSSNQSSCQEPTNFSRLRGSVTSDENEKVNDTRNDDVSLYSEAMTIASSVGITELASPPLKRSECMSALPDINIELDDSRNDSSLTDWRPGNRVQFDIMQEMRRMEIPKTPLSDTRQALQTSLSDRERLDNVKTTYDYRIHLSDSDISHRKFSKEVRTRLISRVENAISPDMKMMLMADSMPISAS